MTYRVSFGILLLATLGACSKANTNTSQSSVDTGITTTPHSVANQIPVAPRPADPCSWIPQHEVESIIGPLAEPPRSFEGGCRYMLPIPESVKAKREKYLRTMEAISKMPGAGPMRTRQFDPYAIDLTVDVAGDIHAERGAAAAGKILQSFASDPSSVRDTVEMRRAANGWDIQRGHGGRIGHVDVELSVASVELEIPRDKLDTLAAHVRNRIPDLPFPMPADYSAGQSRDPCVLLTRPEAEAVLGPLVVAPYRSANDGPLAYPNGTSCAYFTRRHHVLIITPHWVGGKSAIAATNGVAGLIGHAIDNSKEQSADTLEGNWDQAAMDIDGRLNLLKGDRLLEIHYLMSSTDEAGALKLARTALERLVAAQ